MGSSLEQSLSHIECFSLEKFQNEKTPRKMTIHVLSDNKRDSASFVEILTGESISTNNCHKWEREVKTKLNLYSFMNFIIYDSAEEIMKHIKKKSKTISNNPKSEKIVYSEVVVVLDNKKINEHIDIIKNEINKKPYDEEGSTLKLNPYFVPFLIFLSPNILDLSEFIPSKTFHYKTCLRDLKKIKNKENIANADEIFALFRKINVLFSYYNELGDTFSFMNSEDKETQIKLEDDTNIAVFINILFIGRTGSGKSTLINLLLDEKKSIEGGIGFSTTTKNIIVYTKKDIPLRFYDVKGIENEETVKNYSKILSKYNGKNKDSQDVINAIIYCMPYKREGTIVEEMENRLFTELVNYNIPILFVNTLTHYNPDEKVQNPNTKIAREMNRNRIENAIKSLIKDIFEKKNKPNEADAFIKDYIKFFYVNLVRDYNGDLPPFGIDKLLSFFTESVPKEDWENLEKSCFKNEAEECKALCINNPFLKSYSDFNKIQLRNKNEALNYLKGLKAEAFFSGMIPFLDFGMEYFYRSKYKNKLKSLYGFDYDKAEKILNMSNNSESIEMNLTAVDIDTRSENVKFEESMIEEKIDENISNKGRNTGSIIRGAGEIVGVVIKALPTVGKIVEGGAHVAVKTGVIATKVAVSSVLKLVSWVLLPVSLIGFGALSCYNIHKDCNNILEIFDKAFTPLRFETLNSYANSFKNAINYLEFIAKKIIDDDKKENLLNEKK